MKQISLVLCILVALIHSVSISAYEIDTHEKLSIEAYSASNLQKDPDVQGNLGVAASDKFPGSDGIRKSIIQLIGDGAKFEDDVTLSNIRPLNHFFNPLNNAPLTVGIALGNTSPDWALEDAGVIGKQAFSYRDARQYFYDALTKIDKAEREQSFGLTFQTLGQVIHHIQDMAQPQHVRNDAHLAAPIVGNPSAYEKYTNNVRSTLHFSGYAPVYSGTDTPAFNKPRNFWTTGTGKGLAQFTNSNFVSAGTNLTGTFANIQPNSRFPSPSGAGVVVETKQISDPVLASECPGSPIPQGLVGQINFIGTPVEDKVTGVTEVNKRTSTYSIFDEDLQNYSSGLSAVFTLNRFNFCEAHKFLIPRAVAYSAGLINYFFRGKIDFVPDPQNSDAHVIKNLGPEAMKGTFALYYDADDGLRYPVPGATWDLTIPKDGQADGLTFTPPDQPAPSMPDEYILVFKGDMGEEKQDSNSVGAVAAKVVRNPEPDIYIINPDYHHIQRFSPNGDFRTSYSTGKFGNVQENGLSIFKENRYYNWNSTNTGPPYSGAASKNGVDFAFVETANGVTNNGQMVFVTHVNDVGATVSIFDLDGNPLQSRPVSPTWWMEGGSVYVAANRTHFATTSNGYLYGYSIQGGQVFSISGLDIFSQYVAMTIDRIFAVSGSQILSYTLDGGALGAILPVPPGIVGCIEATEKRFYITTQSGGQRRLHIYKRLVDRGSDQSIIKEGYSFLKSIALDPGFYEPQCSVDKAYMEALYKP